jgi:hypothetical protein
MKTPLHITLSQETVGVVYFNISTQQFLVKEGLNPASLTTDINAATICISNLRGLTTEQMQFIKENDLKECEIIQTRVVEMYK